MVHAEGAKILQSGPKISRGGGVVYIAKKWDNWLFDMVIGM